MSTRIIPFEEALAETSDRRRHLLLGNGFSAEGFDGFLYGKLIDRACRDDDALRSLFDKHGAGDFGTLIARADDPDIRDYIRGRFTETLSAIHPKRGRLTPEQRANCSEFLSHFLREKDQKDKLRGELFTSNYDMMLYWVLAASSRRFGCWDGLKAGEWRTVYPHGGGAGIFYLHGGMHIQCRPRVTRNRRQEFRKLQSDYWAVGDLVDVIGAEIKEGRFPLIVAEGSTEEKWRRISGNEYLHGAFTRFRKACRTPADVLFTYGHSLNGSTLTC